MTVWKDVVGYEGHYQVSGTGQVRSIKKKQPRLMSTFLNRKGYPRITLTKEGEMKQLFVHRLVAEAFIGSIGDGMAVNHIDGNKQNNELSNLEIISHKENVLHSCYVLGGLVKPVLMLNPKTFEIEKEYESVTVAANATNIELSSICRVCSMERNFAGGFSWIFKEDYNEENIRKKENRLNEGKGRKKVLQIDIKKNEVIKVFDGVRVAERELGISTIKHCLSGRTKTAGGYKWAYLEEANY